MDVQTENFLEEIVDRVTDADADTQTDPFLDRPPSPLYVPAKTGVDVETQIYEGDLFDFDVEVGLFVLLKISCYFRLIRF